MEAKTKTTDNGCADTGAQARRAARAAASKESAPASTAVPTSISGGVVMLSGRWNGLKNNHKL